MNPDTYSIKEVIEQRFDEMGEHLIDIKEKVEATDEKVGIQNGRVRALEEWSNNAKKIIENTVNLAEDTLIDYKTDRARLWVAWGLLLVLGGTIITLSIMAINTKIEKGITDALSNYGIN